MAQPLGNHLDRDAFAEPERRHCVAKVVESGLQGCHVSLCDVRSSNVTL
jgi:hypothetical protein